VRWVDVIRSVHDEVANGSEIDMTFLLPTLVAGTLTRRCKGYRVEKPDISFSFKCVHGCENNLREKMRARMVALMRNNIPTIPPTTMRLLGRGTSEFGIDRCQNGTNTLSKH